MRRLWLLFAQTVTVLVALWFVLVTLKPEWLNRRAALPGLSLMEAPASAPAALAPGSLSQAARKASPAVVSINTSKVPERSPQQNDPWFRFFFGERDEGPQVGLGSGVIVSPEGFILTNNHVISSPADARQFVVEFDFETTASGERKPVTTVELWPERLFVTDPLERLDFTLIALGRKTDG